MSDFCDPMDCSMPGPSVLCCLPWVFSNSCPLSQWCCPTVSSSVAPFSSCPQSFPVSGFFPVSWLLTSGGQSIGALVSVFPVNIQGWSPLGLTGLILQSKGLSRVFSQHHSSKESILCCSTFFMVQLLHSCMTTWETIALTRGTFVSKRGYRGTHTTVCIPIRPGFRSWLLICTCCVCELANFIFLGLTLPHACRWLRRPKAHGSLPFPYWSFFCPDPSTPPNTEMSLMFGANTVPCIFLCMLCTYLS